MADQRHAGTGHFLIEADSTQQGSLFPAVARTHLSTGCRTPQDNRERRAAAQGSDGR